MITEMIKLETIFVERLPYKEDMEKEKIYISNNRTQATHLCPCGCGTEILTPFGRGGFHMFEYSDESLTISEPIVHSKCKNTYKIYKNFVIWS